VKVIKMPEKPSDWRNKDDKRSVPKVMTDAMKKMERIKKTQ